MLITAAVAALAMTQGTTQEMRLLRYPNIHGNQLLFTYAGDLWTADSPTAIARRLTAHPNNESRAKFSPDGSMIAFTASYDGNDDVYVMPSEGGEPTRLTFDSVPENVVGWTPDGKVAYLTVQGSISNRMPRLMLIDPKGGLPQPTPVLESADVSFSPDGSKVAYHRMNSNQQNWRHYRGGTQGRISIYDLKNNTYSELPSGNFNSYSPMWIGNSIYFVSDREIDCINLYKYDLDSKSTKRLTDFTDGDIKWPSSDGKTIVFERDGYLYEYATATDQLTKTNPRVLSDDVAARPALKKLGAQITFGTLSPSGARVAVEARGEVFSVPVKSGDTRDMTNTQSARERFPTWSDDGQNIAYASDAGGTWQLYTMPQMGGAATKITELPSTSFSAISWSPDSKKIAFATRDYVLHVVDVATKQVTDFDTDQLGQITAFDWSPDSKWIAYIKSSSNQFGAVWLYDVASNKKSQITDGYYRDDTISFDLNGKYLYVVSARDVDPTPRGDDFDVTTASLRQRVYMIVLNASEENPLMNSNDEEPVTPPTTPGEPTGTPKPDGAQGGASKSGVDVKIDLPDLGNRVIALPLPPGNYSFLIGAKNGVLIGTGDGITKFSVEDQDTTPVFSGALTSASFNPARTKMLYQSGPRLGVVDLHPGAKVGDGIVNTDDVEAIIDPRQEWKQMFWDAWRWERDNFYDANMRGLDWKAMGDHYAAFLPYVAHRSDLNYLIAMLISELGTSHTYDGGGDMGLTVRPVAVGHLGADYEVSNGKVRIAKVYKGASFYEDRRGPLGDPGVNVKEGDYLLAIDGQSVDANTNPNSLMVDKANKYVTITVNSAPSMDGARKVRVRPIANESQLRYEDWEERNRQMVAQLSGGRIGYLHVPNTSTEGAIEFVKGYYSNVDKDALIVDERFNGGGSIPTPWIDILSRSYETYFRGRHGSDLGFPVRSIDGPKCMLINGYAGSGGDMFPYLFRRQKIGPLIGTRTWGGLVGYNEQYALSDGGWVTAPEAAFYEPTTGKWIAENHGIDPDIDVDARPDLVAQGQDPQLHEAVNYLLKQLKDHPPVKVKRPDPIPIKH